MPVQVTQSKDNRFYFDWFPPLQIGLALLFAAASLLGPLLIPQLDRLILVTAGLGLLLGLVTLRIGWRVAVEKRLVGYPFAAWSARLLRPLVQPGPESQPALAKRLAKGQRPVKSPAKRGKGFAKDAVKDKTESQVSVSPRLLALGWTSLVVGGALVLGIVVFCYMTFMLS